VAFLGHATRLAPDIADPANEPVPVHVLAQALWDDRLPTTGRTALQNHVLRLRRALGPDAGSRIRTRPPGYLIDVHDDELDLSRFIKLHDSARVACQQGAWAEAELLDELRLQAIELRTHAMLRLGLGGGSTRNSAPEAAAAPPTTPRAARPSPFPGGGRQPGSGGPGRAVGRPCWAARPWRQPYRRP
jgi:hypothetical protein